MPVHLDRTGTQNTVWAWLLGPYLTALVRERGKTGIDQER
jgi:hypothetical protein